MTNLSNFLGNAVDGNEWKRIDGAARANMLA